MTRIPVDLAWADDYEEMRQERDAALARAEAAEARAEALAKRVADLERVARWRPVTEKPPQWREWYQTVIDDGAGPRLEHQLYDPLVGWAMSDTIYWRFIPPLPAPAAAATPEARR